MLTQNLEFIFFLNVFQDSLFQDVIYKKKKIIYIYIISTLSILCQIDV